MAFTLILSMRKKRIVSRTKRIGQGASAAHMKSSPFLCNYGKHDKGGYPSDDNNDDDNDTDDDDDKEGVGGHPRGDSLVPMLAKADSPVVLSFTALAQDVVFHSCLLYPPLRMLQ